MVESERALDINEGLASYTGVVLTAQAEADAIARALEELTAAEDGESFVRTFAYASGPAYGLLLDAAAPGWTRRVRASDDPAVLLMHALGVQPVADAAAARYGGAELRLAEERREQQRQARMAALRRRFVDGPVLVMPGGGSGFSDSRGAVVIPDVGTVWFGEYRMTGPWGALEADKGVLLSTDGRTRRLPAPARHDDTTTSGDGRTLKVAPGWVVREGARQGDYEVVRRPCAVHSPGLCETADGGGVRGGGWCPFALGDAMRPDVRAVDAPDLPVDLPHGAELALKHLEDAARQLLPRPERPCREATMDQRP